VEAYRKAMARKGRPTSYSIEIADAICEEIATTDQSLLAICTRKGMPSQSIVYRWLEAHWDFREKYAHERERQADVLASQILEISEDGANDYIQTEDGEAPNREHIQRSRLRVDSRKWRASKLAPKKYGDKVAAERRRWWPDTGGPDCRVREAQGLRVKFPEKLGFLSKPNRYKVLYAGRGGIKSWSIAQHLLIAGAKQSLRIPCARETMQSIRESSSAPGMPASESRSARPLRNAGIVSQLAVSNRVAQWAYGQTESATRLDVVES
jgi:hypothetical protein